MGVSGCGKSTVAKALATALDGQFIDGDDLHPRRNVDKMAAGRPLTDDDRWPWLDLVGQAVGAGDGTVVIACSALKRSYRLRIAQASGDAVMFVHLHGSRAVLWDRMSSRPGHFMPPALLDSQLATLEPPGADEAAVTVDIDQSPQAVLAAAMAGLRESAQWH